MLEHLVQKSWRHDQNSLFPKKASSSGSYPWALCWEDSSHRISIEFMNQCGKCDVVTVVLSPWLKVSKTACSSCSVSTFCAHTRCTLFLSPSRRSRSSWAVGEALGSGSQAVWFHSWLPHVSLCKVRSCSAPCSLICKRETMGTLTLEGYFRPSSSTSSLRTYRIYRDIQ